ncbi:MAG TPA: phospholipase D family protein [Cryomorphaceae bacterium]|nr:phospholipase D family protein [Cryomorphaceae bacterium]
MAEFLTTSGTSYHIENIVRGSNKKLVMVSPFLQISETLLQRLIDAEFRGVEIILIYGKAKLKSNEKQALSKLKNLTLYYLENLHAKCFFNEREMIITSMNMYEFSEKNNREMGVLIRRSEDSSLFEHALEETHSILKASTKTPLYESKADRSEKYQKSGKERKTTKRSKGACIRCSTEIPFDPERPYCYSCYLIWVEYENAEYVERVCHCCGKAENSTMMHPLCYPCFKGAPQQRIKASSGW